MCVFSVERRKIARGLCSSAIFSVIGNFSDRYGRGPILLLSIY
ncbi:hypothetical protein HNQ69_000306 [Bartonella callosciuri]|uniref:Uncharacterized protein n=1 Tax=Bartonella callosciuri TaxID=686223 RepID=A0A840NVB9_9HYPH|nr:hypothetical protein [Bartonella callosciuri]MBB5073202.1 hypothetical protein [Bartonella callosciuri]